MHCIDIMICEINVAMHVNVIQSICAYVI